jgi:hypothetical protein
VTEPAAQPPADNDQAPAVDASGAEPAVVRASAFDVAVTVAQAVGEPAVAVAAIHQAGGIIKQGIKTMGEVRTARIAAEAENLKTYTEAGHPDGPGAHEG